MPTDERQASLDDWTTTTHSVPESPTPQAVAPHDPLAVDTPETHDQLLTASREHAHAVAAHHDLAVAVDGLEWEVSTRSTRRAGALKYVDDGDPTDGMTVSLTWAAFEKYGWEEFSATVRHELAHAEEVERYGESSHGPRFAALAEDLGAPINCRIFKAPKWWIGCPACDLWAPRYKRSKTVKNPGDYRCNGCAGPLDCHPGDWKDIDDYAGTAEAP